MIIIKILMNILLVIMMFDVIQTSTLTNNQQESTNGDINYLINNLIKNLSLLNDRLLKIENIVHKLQQQQQQDQNNQSINNDNDNKTILMAKCNMRPNRHIALLNQQDINGEIKLTQVIPSNKNEIEMSINLNGLKVGCENQNENLNDNNTDCNLTTTNNTTDYFAFGMHIHEGSDLSYDCQSVGNHYNPLNQTHGSPTDIVRHLGDLGNIYANQFGIVQMNNLKFSNLSLNPDDQYSIINRTIVIHSGRDDYGRNNNPSSKITGNSGIRISCCLIQLVESQQPDQQQLQHQQQGQKTTNEIPIETTTTTLEIN